MKNKKKVLACKNSKRCNLCPGEKIVVISLPRQDKLLNERSKIILKCKDEKEFLLRYLQTHHDQID